MRQRKPDCLGVRGADGSATDRIARANRGTTADSGTDPSADPGADSPANPGADAGTDPATDTRAHATAAATDGGAGFLVGPARESARPVS
jgi:hypothetical protein